MSQGSEDRWGSRSVDIFERLEQIGEGTYGQVYRCRNKLTGEIVALKKVRMDNEKEGFPITAIREIKILRQLDNSNVVKLKEIVTSSPATDYNKSKGSIYMVFEYMDHDLTGLMDTPGMKFTPSQIKCYMMQLLTGLHYCHTNGVLHRDIKGSNLLINNKGILKLADFGLARSYNEQNKDYTNRVITLWYRPPELLLGATTYGPAIDMWSVGCIMAELIIRKPLFPGRNEIDQIDLIFRKCGAPMEENWIEGTKLPWYHMFKPTKPFPRRLKQELAAQSVTADAIDLIDKLLTLDPKKRISASDALDAEYFWVEPRPCSPSSLPHYASSHEYQTKKRRQQQKETGAPAPPPNTNNINPHIPPPMAPGQSGGLPQQLQQQNSQPMGMSNGPGGYGPRPIEKQLRPGPGLGPPDNTISLPPISEITHGYAPPQRNSQAGGPMGRQPQHHPSHRSGPYDRPGGGGGGRPPPEGYVQRRM
mmetsp:Transcript_31846/g.51412  ORF Transcript_31846/g.51412 Transcript_31846/m.51412 type:complete len:476 (+) Transcript_31846:205-1632(+)